MQIQNNKEPLVLLIGDIVVFLISLWITLVIRYAEAPSQTTFIEHILPFSILFIIWVAVFYIAGLYEKHTLMLKSNLPKLLINAQITNSIIAVLFFYLIPTFGITPKTNIFLYLVVSLALFIFWRVYIVSRLRPDKREEAILIGSGEEMRELIEEVNNNSRYSLKFISSIDLNELDALDFEDEILNTIYSESISTIVIDLKNEKVEPILPRLYNLIFGGVQFIDKYKIYEDIFDRVPLSLIGYNWFLENISNSSHITYDILKRAMDISASLIFGVLSLAVYPFVYVAIKLDDGGPIFIHQDRVGRNNTTIKILKFRSMMNDDKGQYGNENTNKITRVGGFLRKTRIDELPQLWNVVSGNLSLIGPRPELPTLVKKYEEGIHYYAIRHLIKPGLSGWAQIYHDAHPHHGTDIKETKVKLSYDLYYLKNRSFLLDIKIAIKTVRTLLSRSGI